MRDFLHARVLTSSIQSVLLHSSFFHLLLFQMATQNDSKSSRAEKKTHISEQPVTLSNWYRHIDWVNVVFVAVIPFFGLIAAFSTPLLWKTGIWALVYYFLTGLGITAGEYMLIFQLRSRDLTTSRLPQTLVPYFLHRRSPSPTPARWSRRRGNPRLHSLVVS